MNGLIFIPGTGVLPDFPLGRFLPLPPEGIFSDWLMENIRPGDWVLDPLGSSPQAALEAAHNGYRVITACNNPVIALMLEVLAQAPQPDDFQGLIAQLADSRRGEERLEIHIESQYQTICPNCQRPIQAEGYIWRKGLLEPFARIVDCPICGAEGEYPLEEQDRISLQRCGSQAMIRSRALVRIGIPNATENPVIQEVMESYPDRSIYILFNLINRIDALPVSEDQRRLLQALLLTGCDAGTMLWPHPVIKTRPRLISPPGEFIEVNLWKAFQNAVSGWCNQTGKIPFAIYPNLPDGNEGGICLYPGRLTTIGQLPNGITPRATITVIPYPNQAFWSYSAIWSGWIWGRKTARALHGVLGRQRYDSRWIGAVLTSSFHSLPKDLPVFALLPEAVPGLLTASMAAGQCAGLKLEGMAYEQEADLLQIRWQSGYTNDKGIHSTVSRTYRDAMADFLRERGEPSSYMQLAGAGMESISDKDALPAGKPGLFDEVFTRMQQAQKENFEDAGFLKVYGSRAGDSQGSWWFKKPEPSLISLADRLEEEILVLMKDKSEILAPEVRKILNHKLRGFLTPPPSLVDAILGSYISQSPQDPGILVVDVQKFPQAFESEIPGIMDLVEELGGNLGFKTKKDEYFTWESDQKPAYKLFTTCDGRINRWVNEFGGEPIFNIILCPEIRMDLIFFKIGRDPRLLEALGNWRLLGFEQFHRIAANKDPLWAFRDALSDPGKMPDGQSAQISFLS